MEFKRPKPKKNPTPKQKLLLPSKNEKEIVGVFNGQYVVIHDWDCMNYLYESGSFGKGTLSKGQPSYHITEGDIPKIIVHPQFENYVRWISKTADSFPQKPQEIVRNNLKLSLQSVSHFLKSTFDDDHDNQGTWKSWKEKHKQKSEKVDSTANWSLMDSLGDTSDYMDKVFSNVVSDILQSKKLKKPTNIVFKSEEVIVLYTSFNSQSQNISLTNVNAVLKTLPFAFQENLNLGLEESFFLKSVQQCLNVVDLNFSELGNQDLWEKFNSVDKNFTQRYITYNYYRSKGWVVRSGLKFGGDYLLYKNGPEYYHGSYLIKVLDGRKGLTWREFTAINRLVETFNKDLLLCNIISDNTAVDKETYSSMLNNHSVQEVLVRRWFPSKKRFNQENP